MHQAFHADTMTICPMPLLASGSSTQSDGAPLRIAVVGTFSPRQCGIATFTGDLVAQLGIYHPEITTEVYAVDGSASKLVYRLPRRVIRTDSPASWSNAAREINAAAFDAVWLQHEFGIFGAEDGEAVCAFAEGLTKPLVTTFHTVLAAPSARQMRIMRRLLAISARVMVMSRYGKDLLVSKYGGRPQQIDVIEHGAPDRPMDNADSTKRALGLDHCNVLMTFGLIGPGKGLERMIEAFPAILARYPRTVYRIVGITHPNLVAEQGEAYREELHMLANRLGVAANVEWVNQFLNTADLLDQLAACDIYVTPYLNMQQATSGTLSYAVALGRAVVSTPYVHARELLADGVGVLVEPGSSDSLSHALNALLGAPEKLKAMQLRTYRRGRRTIWREFAHAAASFIDRALYLKQGSAMAERNPAPSRATSIPSDEKVPV